MTADESKDDIQYEYNRALLFFKRKIPVHASTKLFFTNGLIVEISKKYVVIRDNIEKSLKFIFFNELRRPLEPYNDLNRHQL